MPLRACWRAGSTAFQCPEPWHTATFRPLMTRRTPSGVFFALIRTQCFLSTRTTSRSEEHTSELQSRGHLVCRLLLEKKNHSHQIDTEHAGVRPACVRVA